MNMEGRIFLRINPSEHGGGGGRCTLLPPLLFAFYSKYLEATHTWKFLTLQTFLLRIPLWEKKRVYHLSEYFEKSVQKSPVLEKIKKIPLL